MADVVVKIKGDGDYPLDVDAQLADLTGDETHDLETYIGGWNNLESGSTRSLIAMIWLAKRQSGKPATLAEIGQMKGIMFGDTVDVAEADDVPPAEAA